MTQVKPPTAAIALADDKGLQDILAAEFNYIAQATVQNNEDRVSSFFWVSAAAIVGVVVGLRLDSATPPWVFQAFAGACSLFILLGWLAILQLAQLRASWFSAIRAMNRIKLYYYSRVPEAQAFQLTGDPPGTVGVFQWMTEPQPFKFWSIGLLRCLSIALIDAAFAVAATVFFYLGQKPTLLESGGDLGAALWRGALSGLVIAALQLWSYAFAVKHD
ncbi:MAG: hypothetical protein KIS91_17440 [Anaerolineae bacterium]|nr:hypothetical protein [Anaerolineae bacterium]